MHAGENKRGLKVQQRQPSIGRKDQQNAWREIGLGTLP